MQRGGVIDPMQLALEAAVERQASLRSLALTWWPRSRLRAPSPRSLPAPFSQHTVRRFIPPHWGVLVLETR